MVQNAEKVKILPIVGPNDKCIYSLVGMDNAQGSDVLLPLKKVEIKGELRGALATTCVEMTYLNPHEDRPLECKYSFPLEKSTMLANLEVSIDDRVMITKIIDKEDAKEKYDDSVAAGKAVVMAERKKKDEVMTVRLGNLMPGQTATLKATILSRMDVVGG